MARISRPPGFDMTYRPSKATFGPPLATRLPSLIYFAFALVFGVSVALAPLFDSNTWLYQNVVVGDRTRVMSAAACAILIFASALAAVLRQQMSGVVVHPDGIEIREVIAFSLPRIKRYVWPQIDKVAIPAPPKPVAGGSVTESGSAPKPKKIRLDLWDGTHEWLPDVARLSDLSVMIERVAMARAIPIEGGTGLVDDLASPFADDAEEA